MVLASQAIEWFEAKKKKRTLKVAAMFREAQRLSKETGEAAETIFDRLYAEDWQPPES